MRLFSKQNFEPRIFKDRSIITFKHLKTTTFYINKKYSFFLLREFRFETIHFGIFKRILKKISKKINTFKILKKKNT